MFTVIWEYEIRPGSEAAFEALYGMKGEWVALFREYRGYLGTELLRDERPHHYLTLDRWESEADYAAFLEAAKPRYAEIDTQGDALTLDERRIGRYTAC
ncbi:MAG TPA: antibiotic biosynthesis monooxygenase family protein [Pseudoxanthomonas sp.]